MMKEQRRLRMAAICIGLGILVTLFAFPGMEVLGAPTTITVNSLDDDDGSCSLKKCTLRQAINDASSGDTINFSSSLMNGTITVGSQLTIDKDLIIENQNKMDLTISGADLNRIFYVNYGIDFTVENLTLLDGFSTGGAVYNEMGNVTINHCVIESGGFSGASTGPVYNHGGTMAVNRTTFLDNTGVSGGAINNTGFLTVTDSTFENNLALNYGGAIYNSLGSIENMELTITGSTFKGNATTNFNGGAIYNDSYGPLTITNSTFSGNTAGNDGGGIYSDTDTDLMIYHSTFSGNNASSATDGGALTSFGYLKMYNSIFANSGVGYDCYWNYGATAVSIRNIIENNAPSPYDCETPYLTSDPMLDPIANNGGGTETMALQSGSPAIDEGHASYCPETDQRGDSRPQGDGCDLGAYEYDSFPSVISSVAADPNPTSADEVDFTVTFNETVTGVDITDFTLTTAGLTATSVLGVSGSEDIFTVTVDTGRYAGTLCLNVVDDDSIEDESSNPLGGAGAGNGNFNTGECYTVRYTFVYLPLVIR